MRRLALSAIIISPLLLIACGPMAESTPAPLTEKQAARMEKELKGRVAGLPQNCISNYRSDGLVKISDSVLIYKPGGPIYVNNLRGSCPGLARDTDIMVTQVYGSQLCDGDLVKLVDRTSGMPGPVCSLGQFTPYTKVKS